MCCSPPIIQGFMKFIRRLITFTGDGDLRGGTEVNSGEQLQYIFNNLENSHTDALNGY